MAEESSHSSSSAPRGDQIEMTDRKAPHFDVGEKATEVGGEREGVDNDPAFEGTKSTADDRLDMERLGKKQQLIVCNGSAGATRIDSY